MMVVGVEIWVIVIIQLMLAVGTVAALKVDMVWIKARVRIVENGREADLKKIQAQADRITRLEVLQGVKPNV